MIINEIHEIFEKIHVVPVITMEDANDAQKLAAALEEGGMPVAEITFRTGAAAETISIMTKAFPNMLIGAGTVLSTRNAEDAIKAGARFIVSPGLNPEVVRYCIERNVPVIPGAVTATEIETAMSMGLRYLKFFPAEAMGGVRTIKALCAPYPEVEFMPTGGINMDNMAEYLMCSKVFAVGGSWIAPKELIADAKFEQITENAAKIHDYIFRNFLKA